MDAVGRLDELAIGVTCLFVGREDAAVRLGIEVGEDALGSRLQRSARFGIGEVGQHQEAITVVVGNLFVGEQHSHGWILGPHPFDSGVVQRPAPYALVP